MFSLAVTCLVITGLCAQPPAPLDLNLQKLLAGTFEKMHRDQLEMNKSRRAFLEEMIEMYEKDLKGQSLYPQSQASRIRQDLVALRETVQYMKSVQRELEGWERERKTNPTSQTDSAAIDRLERLYKEHQSWREAWDRGLIAPRPRVKK